RMNAIKVGKLSTKGSSTPRGYQIKWPMPSEGKASPWFQWTRQMTLAAHSFWKIWRPTQVSWSGVRTSSNLASAAGWTAVGRFLLQSARPNPPSMNKGKVASSSARHRKEFPITHLKLKLRRAGADPNFVPAPGGSAGPASIADEGPGRPRV